MVVSLKVNGAVHSVAVEPDTPLLYVLRKIGRASCRERV